MTNYSDQDTNTEDCDVCGQAIGDTDAHFPHPDDCGARCGGECYCTSGLVAHDECCIDCHPELVPTETQREERGQSFFPPLADLMRVPQLDETEDMALEDKVVDLHYVWPDVEWWIVERDRKTNIAFGCVCPNDSEMAKWEYVDLDVLEQLSTTIHIHTAKGWRPTHVVVKRDLAWIPRAARECHLPG